MTPRRIALSFTTCNRFELFSRTLRSLCRYVEDVSGVSTIIHLDDNSSQSDQEAMSDLTAELFSETKVQRHWNIPFPHNRRHAGIMQILHTQAQPFDYLFHCEDDWEFFESGAVIGQAIKVMESVPEIAQVGFWRKPPEHEILSCGDAGYWVFPHDPTLEFEHRWKPEDDIDPAWPHFSLRPSLIRVSALAKVGNFGRVDRFEYSYAKRWTEAGFESAFLSKKYCRHLAPAWEDSAYCINQSAR